MAKQKMNIKGKLKEKVEIDKRKKTRKLERNEISENWWESKRLCNGCSQVAQYRINIYSEL